MLKLITSLWQVWLLVLIVFLLRLFKPQIKGFIWRKNSSLLFGTVG